MLEIIYSDYIWYFSEAKLLWSIFLCKKYKENKKFSLDILYPLQQQLEAPVINQHIAGLCSGESRSSQAV